MTPGLHIPVELVEEIDQLIDQQRGRPTQRSGVPPGTKTVFRRVPAPIYDSVAKRVQRYKAEMKISEAQAVLNRLEVEVSGARA